MQFPQVGPEAVLGIELNTYAAELARVVIWIGHIQWMLDNGFAYAAIPSSSRSDNIRVPRTPSSTSRTGASPRSRVAGADVIVGNPPFLGGKLMRATWATAT